MPQAEAQTVPHQTHGEGLRQEPLKDPLCADGGSHSNDLTAKRHSKVPQRPGHTETKVTAHTHRTGSK